MATLLASETLSGVTQLKIGDILFIYIFVSGSRKRDLMEQTKKIEFFMLIKSYNLSQLSAKILEGKPSTCRETGS